MVIARSPTRKTLLSPWISVGTLANNKKTSWSILTALLLVFLLCIVSSLLLLIQSILNTTKHDGFRHNFDKGRRQYLVEPPSMVVGHIRRPTSSSEESELSLREKFEQQFLPNDMQRTRMTVSELRRFDIRTQDFAYDILHCPYEPPPGYPQSWNLLEILDHWNPDDTNLPSQGDIFQGLCVFDFGIPQERKKAKNYQNRDLPFVMQNHSQVNRAVERWNTPNYLEALLDPTALQRVDHSVNNHFQFWRTAPSQNDVPVGWRPPTDSVDMTFSEWKQKALKLELSPDSQAQQEHWYLRLTGLSQASRPSVNEYLYDELPFFDPSRPTPNFLTVDPDLHRGINCRFGMKGIISEMHTDNTFNFIVLLGGQRRYILAHPDQCNNLELYKGNHPSSRHSSLNWSAPVSDLWQELRERHADQNDEDLLFPKASANEVVLQPGDILYLPTHWFHFIVSLNLNYQCNARSGVTTAYDGFIEDCMSDIR